MTAIRTFAAIAMLAAITGIAACGDDDDNGSSDDATASSTQIEPPPAGALVNDSEFSACMDISFPPMEYYEETSDEPQGFDVATMAALAEVWGVEPVYEETSFEGLLPALSAGRCDVVWSAIFVTPERTKTFPTVPYGESGTVLLVQGGNPDGIASPDDICGKTIVAQTGTTLLDLANDIAQKCEKDGQPAATVQQYAKATELIQQLVVGRADAAVTQDIEASYRESQAEGQFEVGYAYPDKETFGVYFPPDNAALGEAIHDGLAELEADGTLEAIAEEEGFPAEGIAVQEIEGNVEAQ